MDDERLKGNGGGNYWKELLALLELASKELEKNYKDKIFKLIMRDRELQTKIKDKYFSDIKTIE